MPSLRKPQVLVIERPVDVALIKAHMAGSLGLEKADAVVSNTLKALTFPLQGELAADQAESVLSRLALEPGLIGLAAKVTKQMVRNQLAPLVPR